MQSTDTQIAVSMQQAWPGECRMGQAPTCTEPDFGSGSATAKTLQCRRRCWCCCHVAAAERRERWVRLTAGVAASRAAEVVTVQAMTSAWGGELQEWE